MDFERILIKTEKQRYNMSETSHQHRRISPTILYLSYKAVKGDFLVAPSRQPSHIENQQILRFIIILKRGKQAEVAYSAHASFIPIVYSKMKGIEIIIKKIYLLMG